MEAIEFISRYPEYIGQLEKILNPAYLPALHKLKKVDPHDIVRPEHYFNSSAEAMGVVVGLLLKQLRIAAAKEKPTKEERQQQIQQQIDAAKAVLAANGIQSQGLWSIDDVIDKAKELNKRCSKKDARAILALIEQGFDAECGITWQMVEDYVEDYFKNNKPKNKNARKS